MLPLRRAIASLARIRRLRRERLERMRAALERFPALADTDRAALYRKIARTSAAIGLTFRAVTMCPRVAMVFARFVPIVGNVAAIARLPRDRPFIVAAMHFGTTHFMSTVVSRLFKSRNVYIVHASEARGAASARYLRATGNIPIPTSRYVMRHLSKIVAEDPTCVLILAFDRPGGRGRAGRVRLTLLGTEIPVPTGVARLACEHDLPAVELWWEFDRRGPRVHVGRMLEPDPALEPKAREHDFMRRLYAGLERQILKTPHEWTEWASCFAFEQTAKASAQ